MRAALHRELAWLDALLHREVQRLRARYALSVDEFRGIYVSDEQVDAYLGSCGIGAAGVEPACPEPAADGNWSTLCQRLALSPAERRVVLLALAPELDGKYEALYGYLNNDIAHRWPTAELALRLFDDDPGVLAALDEQGRLRRGGLLELVIDSGARRPLLAAGFACAGALPRFVLDLPPALPRECALVVPDGLQGMPAALAAMADTCAAGVDSPALLLAGPPGCGRRRAAEAIAVRLGRWLITVDLSHCADPAATLTQAALGALLYQALVLLEGYDGLAQHDGATRSRVHGAMAALPGPVMLRIDAGAAAFELPAGLPAWRVDLAPPDAASQQQLWRQALDGAGLAAPPADIRLLAERFRLGRSQIERASQAAAFAARQGPQAALPLLLRVAREQSGNPLKQLASTVPRRHGWDDLVLPPATIDLVRAVALAIAHRSRVQEEWGMARVSGSRGMVALFHGASGTGKTMSAGVIAAELGLELYRVNLASVVSKYIGETEKNLERIFVAARHSNAVLLFDEADALFGKRSEVKDAHDRYANLEVAYLLQRLEEHDGPVILATNFARNMDQAFNRRLDQSIEFPRPDARARARLWRQMLRPPLPCATGLDGELDWLAATFDLTGGEIRKAALEAAYLAAAGDSVVTLEILVATATQECRRQGRMVGLAESMPPAFGVAA